MGGLHGNTTREFGAIPGMGSNNFGGMWNAQFPFNYIFNCALIVDFSLVNLVEVAVAICIGNISFSSSPLFKEDGIGDFDLLKIQ